MKGISSCRLCGSKRLKETLSLGKIYLSEFTEKGRKPESYPLNLILCNDCFLVQLQHTTPPKLLYTDNYGYRSGVNITMRNQLKDIVAKALTHLHRKKNRKLVVMDIGANDGTLLKYYPKNFFRIAVEPVKKFTEDCKKNADLVINDFFSLAAYTKKLKTKKCDVITVISCFYDIDDPNEFISEIKKILTDDGILIIQQNYLLSMLEQNAFDNIVHEHLEYYSLSSLEKLLDKHDLEIVDVEVNQINGGSFRTYIKHFGPVRKLLRKERAFDLDKEQTYKKFSKRIKKIKKKVYTFVSKEVRKGKVVYVYGASTRGNTLLQYFDLDKKLIKAAVERNPEKWGKKIASVGIPIISEEQARLDKPDYMLVLPWFFKEEFLMRERKFLENGGHFIFPLPDLEVV